MKQKNQGISFFERYLTLWVAGCIAAGILIGQYIPSVPATLHLFEYANVSIPVAILIWLMIFPMMLKVDFNSVKNVGSKPKGILITGVTNWLIKPFTMFAIAWLFFFVLFKSLIPAELADQYLAGAVLLGAAPCTAMVFVWSHLTKGDAAYTLVQVALNDLIILVAFVPIVGLLLGIGGIAIPWDTLFLSVVLFVVVPLLAGMLTRIHVVKRAGYRLLQQCLYQENLTTSLWGIAAHPDHPLLLPGRHHPAEPAPYPADRHPAGYPDGVDLLHLPTDGGQNVEAATRRGCPCRHDQQFL